MWFGDYLIGWAERLDVMAAVKMDFRSTSRCVHLQPWLKTCHRTIIELIGILILLI